MPKPVLKKLVLTTRMKSVFGFFVALQTLIMVLSSYVRQNFLDMVEKFQSV